MFSAIYIEQEIVNHPRVIELCTRFKHLPVIVCERYGEVFNRSAQNFRLQKQEPALILARKHGNLVLPAPEGYGFTSENNYYFSHMMNCLYDCRYCFLQGMYKSAHYVLFINYEDFEDQIEEMSQQLKPGAVFYSGYDCDSLAMEPVSGFCEHFLPVFRKHSDSILEIRTKSTQIRSLLETSAFDNCIVAMSFTSVPASKQYEHKVPSVEKRIDALSKLHNAGWRVAIRFEPVIYSPNYLAEFADLFNAIFSTLNGSMIHSASIGEFRMPLGFHKSIAKLYPDEGLYSEPITVVDGEVSMKQSSASNQLERLEEKLFSYISEDQYYRCA